MSNTAIRDPRDTQGIRLQYTVDHDGPVLYATGGETIPASVFGFKNIANVIVGASNDGTYFCAARFTKKGGGNTSFNLLWFVAATGEEAGAIDLHASWVRITVIGR